MKREAGDGSRFQNGSGGVVVIPTNSHRSTPRRILEPPSRRRSPKDAAADEVLTPPIEVDGVVSVDTANAGKSESEVAAWTAALLPLVKGKIELDRAKIARTSDILGEVERAHQRGIFTREVLKVSKVLKLGQILTEDWLTGNVGFRRARWGTRCGGLVNLTASHLETYMACVCVHGR